MPFRLLLGSGLLSIVLLAQKPDLSFYPDFRAWMRTVPNSEAPTRDAVISKYGEKLRSDGITNSEIQRRLQVLRTTSVQELENYFWNQFFTTGKYNFNREPNQFLVDAVRNRKPGRALDVGAGEGRNSIYLARQGWTVTALDPAGEALGLLRKRATEAGLNIKTVNLAQEAYDFGQNRWDLVLFSWTNPRGIEQKVAESLTPGGVVVVETAQAWWGDNGLVKMFPQLRLLHYEDTLARSDYFGRRDMQVVRFCAQKP